MTPDAYTVTPPADLDLDVLEEVLRKASRRKAIGEA